MSQVLVTGASGLLGTNTIIELLKNGFFVKALVRDKTKFLLKNYYNVKLIQADFSDPVFLDNLVKDCNFIIHTAAETHQGLIRYSDYYKSNVEFCEKLYSAAVKNGVKRIIHVSTANVFGYGDLQNPGNETTKIKSPFSESLYVKSKMASQELALTYSNETEVVVVNPTFLIGAFDQKPSSGQIILHGYNKRIIFYPPGGKNFVDVKDVASALVKILDKGKSKEAYILSGENLTYKEFFLKLNSISNKKSLLIRITSKC